MDLSESTEYKKRAQDVIPICSQTFSKSPSQFVQGVAPVFLERGSGSHVWDVDGNEFIDYPMALGPIILGYDYEPVNDVVKEQIDDGTVFSLPHPLEVELAEKLVDVIPCAEMARFGKNGSDAATGAVRLARAYTDRDMIACGGYHGWHDWYIGTTTRRDGIPESTQELTHTFEYNDIDSLKTLFEKHPDDIAAVILEPVGIESPEDDFLAKAKEITHENDALLIFDEVVTGFRISLGGAQEYFGVEPDLACFGKAMGNGFPVSALVGQAEIMELLEEVFYSFTFGGETASLAAALKTIEEMETEPVIDHLWEQGEKLQDGYNRLVEEKGLADYTSCEGLAPHTVMEFQAPDGSDFRELKTLFQQECIRRGILISTGHNICYSHTDADVRETLDVYDDVLELMSDAVEKSTVDDHLEGPPLQPVFREP